MDQVRVNLRTRVANSSIRYEKRNGRDVIVVPSATLPDGVVMNRILYPADAIEAGYQSLNRTPAPLGHPMVNGQYVCAMEPEAINGYWVGAWNENVRRVNGRVFLDKIIDVETANATERGRKLLEVINKKEPISTSTGLMLTLTEADHDDYDYIANTIDADHDAILIGEAPAASTQQGVGIFVNAQGAEVEVRNEELKLDDEALESIAESIAWQLEHEAREQKQKPLIDKIMKALRSLLGGADTVETQEEIAMNEAQQKAFDDLQSKVVSLETNMLTADKVAELLKPVTETLSSIQANIAQADEAAKAELVEKVVKANLLDETEAKELSVNTLRKLAAKIPAAGAAAGVFGAYVGNADDDQFSDELPE